MDSIEYDIDANAFYVRLSDEKIVKTIPHGKDNFIDIDKNGKIVGLEVLNNGEIPNVVTEIVRRTDEIKVLT